jgi:hypothetical protein
VDEARDEKHPLHTRFEWNDDVAGENWRRHQAHTLIQSVRISYRKPTGQRDEVRAFHAVRRDDGYVYEPTSEIVQDQITTRIILADMERDWQNLKRRYESFDAFWRMVRDAAEGAAA